MPFEISTGGKTEEIKGFKFKVVKSVGGYLPCMKYVLKDQLDMMQDGVKRYRSLCACR